MFNYLGICGKCADSIYVEVLRTASYSRGQRRTMKLFHLAHAIDRQAISYIIEWSTLNGLITVIMSSLLVSLGI